ncbi:MAG: 4-hydroxy-3-methylbut-2-enyl diphosphate reductase [Candidatus Sumerlaeia bacterium]
MLIAQRFTSPVIEFLKANDYQARFGDVEVYLAREFGFCYGVDKSVKIAFETRKSYPDRRIFITAEIIHNQWINQSLRNMGIGFLQSDYIPDGTPLSALTPRDVVILPAFGAPTPLVEALKHIGCLLVDSTCGSVVHVWKRVERFAREGYTSIIHGRRRHEETDATRSRVLQCGGHYLIVRDLNDAQYVCDYMLKGGDRTAFLERFRHAVSPGFDPDRHLERVGTANQTTMMSSESLEIMQMFNRVMEIKHGPQALKDYVRSFNTICRATQDRQDAARALVEKNLDVMLIVGGFNSSNTAHLQEIGSRYCPSYHIADSDCIVSAEEIVHKPYDSREPVRVCDWLPAGPIRAGFTGGASTPDSLIGDAIKRLLELKGVELPVEFRT